ncbi:hypothetical protein [Haloarchaeobius litoreus]|uniref:Uncharacterized protein n=1 Tax=Haloarchaeobius litoreus TaxID=755306 RepID=A0ABD6DIM8_9EURY|nr:hypothetical protein [Haloarchaeobius litoreus]
MGNIGETPVRSMDYVRRVLAFTATSVLCAVILVAGAAALPVPRVVGEVMLSVAIGGVGLGVLGFGRIRNTLDYEGIENRDDASLPLQILLVIVDFVEWRTWGNLLGLACYVVGGLLVFLSIASVIGVVVG